MDKPAVSVEQIRELDRAAIEKYGLPSIVLMENAGRNVSNEIRRLLRLRGSKSVCIVCGLGKNGGDGLVVARHLIDADFQVKVYVVGKADQFKGDALINYRILKNVRYPIMEIDSVTESFKADLRGSDIVVDALLGSGLNRPIEGLLKEVITAVNQFALRVISIDVPSGLDATTGEIQGVCIKASRTVTFTFTKKGFYVQQGPVCVGKVIVREIGIPKILTEKIV